MSKEKKFFVEINGEKVEVSEDDYNYIESMNDRDWIGMDD